MVNSVDLVVLVVVCLYCVSLGCFVAMYCCLVARWFKRSFVLVVCMLVCIWNLLLGFCGCGAGLLVISLGCGFGFVGYGLLLAVLLGCFVLVVFGLEVWVLG